MPTTSRDRQASVQVLGKISLLLDRLAEEGELPVARLAELVGEPRSTVHRLVGSLQELDLVEPGSRRGTYRLGLRLLRLGSAVVARFDERQAALPVMERLHQQTEETVYLCIRRGYDAVCIERLDGRWVRSMALRLGGALPLHVGAAPRALLAHEPREFWEEYAGHGTLDAWTPSTPTTSSQLFALLEEIRRTGWSISDEDVTLGMAAVGAPIFDHCGNVCAALSLSGPRPAILGASEPASCELIVKGAADISRALGHTGELGQLMAIRLGVDTLCWHLRLERAGLSIEHVLDEAAALGSECVQVNLHHVRDRDEEGLARVRDRARDAGLVLLASGDFLGQARNGDDPAVGVGRIQGWLAQAEALGSPVLRVVSGFYRAELFGRPDLVEAERRYVAEVLRRAASSAQERGVTLLLENHSDFTVAEYRSIVEDVGSDRVGVFLDLINPVAALDDPLPVVRGLAPLARAGHVKDYVFESIPTDDGYHRRGFQVLYRYPGEGVADLESLVGALARGTEGRDVWLTIEGLDNRAEVDDQRERLAPGLALLRRLAA